MLKTLALLSPWGDPPVVQDSSVASGITHSTCQICVTSLPALRWQRQCLSYPEPLYSPFPTVSERTITCEEYRRGKGESDASGTHDTSKAGRPPAAQCHLLWWQVPPSSIPSGGPPSAAPDRKPGTADVAFLWRIWSKICLLLGKGGGGVA